jgi:short-subunit dehydrogenase
MNEQIHRPVALVTGASRGIGAATARELARRGYALALAARSAAELNALAAELTRGGAPALAVPTDMSRPDEVERLARVALAHFGRVDVLVNNAGVGGHGRRFARMAPEDLHHMLAVNFTAPVILTRALLPAMLERRNGAIVFVGSVAGRVALPGSALYSATKYGLRGLAHAVRREVKGRGVRVTLVAPGFIDTTMTRDLHNVPKVGAEPVARVIADAIDRPRREIFVPWYYRIGVLLDGLAPWLGDAVLRMVRR